MGSYKIFKIKKSKWVSLFGYLYEDFSFVTLTCNDRQVQAHKYAKQDYQQIREICMKHLLLFLRCCASPSTQNHPKPISSRLIANRELIHAHISYFCYLGRFNEQSLIFSTGTVIRVSWFEFGNHLVNLHCHHLSEKSSL